MKDFERKAQIALALRNGLKSVFIPNVNFGWLWDIGHGNKHEADLISITDRLVIVEYEIKQSLADFKNDFKKRHSHFLKHTTGVYFVFPRSLYTEPECKTEICETLKDTEFGIITVDLEKLRVTYEKRARYRRGAVPLEKWQYIDLLRIGCEKWWKMTRKEVEGA